ncbi:Peptidyl-prolyl cis-trans isomerase CWC27 isoform 2 [Schistosoma japonicum]|uniref:Spliceosome-associated protein CWC27 homolog n=3 Tax=Schistosoma japonicum TaxID=6182 RepID=C1LH55_SCHJA|nr:Spliceosome-associated protein CWC27 like [Schistosoma japonicum]KAH8868174.1 Spliceosome-associated protein CWC27 like [Schistosoma japonicum]TNN09048.1 Peptidyl-prolyl cis-trans isomerase CWC27 isoform 2 [Schistosoma japonicum]TNN09049.1 Peptidyl-prolyl cis-trans isomerase CWC27 isoform 2 [Schistosoma japonicum]CAX74033.1 CYclophyliN [Schistosoma japonicum]
MSNIYVTEPATYGKVILKTTVGEIEIELWSKETPKACRNFVQLCMEGYYDDTSFHRLVRGFIVQGGDPTGTGEGGESIYGQPFKTEIHSRLSFNRRGLVGMACLDENMNGSQFFFTLGPATELTGKHTLFGRVAGETLFNMLRLGEGDVGRNEKPLRLHRIVSTSVILNPYDDIEPRQRPKQIVKSNSEDEVKVTAKATKNFSLLSFGEEAEEEEEVVNTVVEKFRQKGKSAHDLLSDPRLSSIPVTVTDEDTESVNRAKFELDKEIQERQRRRETAHLQEDEAKAKRIEMLRHEAEELRRQIALSKHAEKNKQSKEKEELERKAREAQEQKEQEEAALARWEAKQKSQLDGDSKTSQPLVDDLDTFSADFASYKAKSKKAVKGSEREAVTLSLLEKFGNRLRSVIGSEESNEEPCKFSAVDDWMKSRLVSEVPTPARKVLDPTMPHPDRYDLYDPRNPLNVRKRGGDMDGGIEKKSRRV